MEQGGLARAGGTVEGGCRVAALEIDREREVGQRALYRGAARQELRMRRLAHSLAMSAGSAMMTDIMTSRAAAASPSGWLR